MRIRWRLNKPNVKEDQPHIIQYVLEKGDTVYCGGQGCKKQLRRDDYTYFIVKDGVFLCYSCFRTQFEDTLNIES